MKTNADCHHFNECPWATCKDCTVYGPDYFRDPEYSRLFAAFHESRKALANAEQALSDRRQAICLHRLHTLSGSGNSEICLFCEKILSTREE